MVFADKTEKDGWWFWPVTQIFIILALAGWIPGYNFVAIISFTQIFYFAQKEGSLLAFSTQARIVYFIFSLLGLWAKVRFPIFILLLFETIMITFTGQCFIALLLKLLPWNKNYSVNVSFENIGER
jgi:hypothetical protein